MPKVANSSQLLSDMY